MLRREKSRMITLIIFLATLFFFIFIGVPVFMSLGLSSFCIWFWQFGSFEGSILLQKMFNGLDNFPLMAIPFFMLAGEVMNTGGISRRLVSFAQSLIGWIKGGLGFAVILASMFIAAILGSASASAAMIGTVMIPAMTARGYKLDFSSALIASSGSIGPIIPPSIPLIIYGVIAQVSIAKLFLGGYIPGIFIGIAFMIYTYFHAKKYNYPSESKPSINEILKSFKDASLTLLLPIIIMGGILGGVFTPTEAGAIAVVYAFIVGFLIYREIKISDIPQIFLRAANNSAMVMVVISTATLLSWVLTLGRVPHTVTNLLLSISENKYLFLIIINIFMVIVGMFLDATSALVILTPVLLPSAITFGIDPLLLGVLLTVNLSIGVLTPPVGLNLYVISGIGKVDLIKLSRSVLPFLVLIFIVLLIMTFFPSTVTYIPNKFLP